VFILSVIDGATDHAPVCGDGEDCHACDATNAGLSARASEAVADELECNHREADTRNPLVTSRCVCADCGALFAAAVQTVPPAASGRKLTSAVRDVLAERERIGFGGCMLCA
jgi:hypothetical protein